MPNIPTNNSTARSTDNTTTNPPDTIIIGALDEDGPLPACGGYECTCAGLPIFDGRPTFHFFVPQNTRCCRCYSHCDGNRIFIGTPGIGQLGYRGCVMIRCRQCRSDMFFRLNTSTSNYEAAYNCYHDPRDQIGRLEVDSAGHLTVSSVVDFAAHTVRQRHSFRADQQNQPARIEIIRRPRAPHAARIPSWNTLPLFSPDAEDLPAERRPVEEQTQREPDAPTANASETSLLLAMRMVVNPDKCDAILRDKPNAAVRGWFPAIDMA